MSKVIIIIGMPGSGKSEYIRTLVHNTTCFYDDYHGDAIDDSSCFEKSRHYESLKNALANGKDCLIADIAYCYENRLNEAKLGIDKIGDDLNLEIEIDCQYFENDAIACRKNVRQRNREQMEEELNNIEEMNSVYKIPLGAHTLPIWKG